MQFETILVPLDGSALAEAALSTAVNLGGGSGARLILLRAVEAHTLPGADVTDAQAEVVREAEVYLGGVQRQLEARGVKAVATSVWYGDAASSIVEAAAARHVDLIVMSTHGRTGLARLILGSVAESVIRGTVTPILLVRSGTAPVQAPRAKARAWETVTVSRPG